MSSRPAPVAEIVSVGTELLLGDIVDTHAATMGRLLAECGVACHRRQTVGDNLERLTEALRLALSRSDVLVTIGGLGPTQDDLTREAVAAALDDELVHEPEVEERLRRLFAQRGIPWTDSQLRQARRPASARLLDNPYGTAPGLLCEKGGKTVIALPGPRGEFGPMAERPVREYLARLSGGAVIRSRTLKVCGMGESLVEAKVRDLLASHNPTIAPYAHAGEVHLRLTARAASPEEADRLLAPLEARVRAILGPAVFGSDESTLESAVVEALQQRAATLAVAESATGGGLGARLTSVAGASKVFLGGVIAYAPEAKAELLGLEPELIARETPVSAEVARRMAASVRERLGADYGVAITGNAGPTADEGDRPVGLVYVAVADSAGVQAEEHRFRATREEVRRRAEQAALTLLRRALLA